MFKLNKSVSGRIRPFLVHEIFGLKLCIGLTALLEMFYRIDVSILIVDLQLSKDLSNNGNSVISISGFQELNYYMSEQNPNLKWYIFNIIYISFCWSLYKL